MSPAAAFVIGLATFLVPAGEPVPILFDGRFLTLNDLFTPS